MRDPNGVVKILDFGFARISDGLNSTPTSMVMGTIEYMSPEQLKGEAVDGRADQFSLAAVRSSSCIRPRRSLTIRLQRT